MAENGKPDQNGGQTGNGNQDPPVPPNPRVPVAGQKQAPGNPFKAIQFSIEFANDQMVSTLCPITKKLYRARFDPSLIKKRDPDERFQDCPVIKGHVLVFDGQTRSVQIIDQMALKDNAELLKEAQHAVKRTFAQEPTPDQSRHYKGLGDDRLKQFVYWARRWLDGKQVVKIEGTVPSMDAIEKLPGRVEREVHNTSVSKERFQKEPGTFGGREIPEYMTPEQAKGQAVGTVLRNTDDDGRNEEDDDAAE